MAAEILASCTGKPQDTADLVSQLQALQGAFDASERTVFQRALEASERRYQDLFNSVLTGVYRTASDGTVVLANPALTRMLGYGAEETLTIKRTDERQYKLRLEAEGEVRALEAEWVRKDGSPVAVRETARLVRDASGAAVFVDGIVEDISDGKRAELFDRGCRRILEMVAQNESLEDLLGCLACLLEAQEPGRSCAITLRKENRLHLIRGSRFQGKATKAGIPIRHGFGCSVEAVRNGRTVIASDVRESDAFTYVREASEAFGIRSAWSTPILVDGEAHGAITMASNESHDPRTHELAMLETASKLAAVALEHRRLYDNLHRQATQDRLTKLPNRLVFEETLSRYVKDKTPVALLWVDLDRFKEVNDSLGHAVGDALICAVADRLRSCVGGHLLARLGGDEFVIVMAGCAQRKQAEACAIGISKVLHSVLQVAEYELFVTASIGISMYPEDASTAAELQQNADVAMYRAKARGKNGHAFFEEKLERGSRERLELETSLRRALQNQELELYYQPQVDLQGNLQGMEALVRWNNPKLGLVAPSEFIPMAEETGLIVPIGTWVIREACRQCAEWHRAGYTNVKVAVNVSALQFYFSDLVEIVRSALETYNLEPQFLEVELTESLLMRNAEDSLHALKRLRVLGVTVAIDDFGTGYSSLSYLQKLPVDVLKIDRSFLENNQSASTNVFIQAITVVAHSLGIRVAAEGVETQMHLDSIRGIGVDLLQGYFFGRPMPCDAATGYLQSSH